MQEYYNREKQLIRRVREQGHVIIYGAGMVGELVLRCLTMQGLRKHVLGFAVSCRDGKTKRDCLHGVSVYGIDEWKSQKENVLVLVATLPDLHEAMGRRAAELQFTHVVFITEKLYKRLCKSLIRNHKHDFPLIFPKEARTRILFMASDNNRVSGAFLCMAELCEQLQEHGIGAGVVLPHYGTGTSLLEETGISYTYIESKDWAYKLEDIKKMKEKIRFTAGLISNRKAKRELTSLIREQLVDLVHCNTTYTYIGAVAAKQCGIPFVWHLRENLEHQGYRIFGQKRAWNLMQQAGKIITVSKYIENLLPLESNGMTDVLYDAVDMGDGACPERNILCGKTLQMIQVGVLIDYKGQKELIEACHILKNRYALDFHLLFVGKGLPDYVEELHLLVKSYNLEENISFYGATKDVFSLYAQSDISFMCSSREAYGRVTIESQLSGCLVIGVNSGATQELIEDGKTGYLYRAGNVQDLAEKIMEAAEDPDKSREIAREGQNHARNTYTRERSIKKMIEIYESVLGRTL